LVQVMLFQEAAGERGITATCKHDENSYLTEL